MQNASIIWWICIWMWDRLWPRGTYDRSRSRTTADGVSLIRIQRRQKRLACLCTKLASRFRPPSTSAGLWTVSVELLLVRLVRSGFSIRRARSRKFASQKRIEKRSSNTCLERKRERKSATKGAYSFYTPPPCVLEFASKRWLEGAIVTKLSWTLF